MLKLAKPALLVKLIDALKMDQVLVFCRTNLDCDLLERYLVGQSRAKLGGRRRNEFVGGPNAALNLRQRFILDDVDPLLQRSHE